MTANNFENKITNDQFIKNEPKIGSFYQVGELKLLLEFSGNGNPSVVFLPAAGMIGLDYLNIHHKKVIILHPSTMIGQEQVRVMK